MSDTQNTNALVISFADLALAATGTTSTRSGAPAFHTVSVEEARTSVKIKDGNRKPAKDGSQMLTVTIGKHTLPLDRIKAGTTRVAVTAEQVEGYTTALQNAVNDGAFDEVIGKAQELAKVQAAKVAANPVKRGAKAVVVAEDTLGLDLDELEAEEGGDAVDTSELDSLGE